MQPEARKNEFRLTDFHTGYKLSLIHIWYEDLYALGRPDCKTFQQAARELRFPDDKKEYFDALEEAARLMKPTD